MRGALVLMMIVYHACYIAVMFRLVDMELFTGFWWIYPRAVASCFIILSGWNLAAKRARGSSFRAFALRAGRLVPIALAISAVTYFTFGKGFVFFGVIHLLAVSSLIAYPLLGRPAVAAGVGVACMAAGLAIGGMRFDFPWLAWLGLRPNGLHPADYMPLAPWFAFIAFGAAAYDTVARLRNRRGGDVVSRTAAEATGSTTVDGGQAPDKAPSAIPARAIAVTALAAIGKRSLIVYLAHLPLLYGIGLAIAAILEKI